MDIATIAYSLTLGALFGSFYGYSFVLQQKSIFSVKIKPLFITILSTIRMLIVGIVFTISLRTGQINPILLTVTFIIVFWIILFIKKATFYAKSRTY